MMFDFLDDMDVGMGPLFGELDPEFAPWALDSPSGESEASCSDVEYEAAVGTYVAESVAQYNGLVENHDYVVNHTYPALARQGLPEALLAPVRAACQALWHRARDLRAAMDEGELERVDAGLRAAIRAWGAVDEAVGAAAEALQPGGPAGVSEGL